MITEQEFEHWKGLDSTKQVFKLLMEMRQEMMDLWANGSYVDEYSRDAFTTCRAYKYIAEMDYEVVKNFYGVDE